MKLASLSKVSRGVAMMIVDANGAKDDFIACIPESEEDTILEDFRAMVFHDKNKNVITCNVREQSGRFICDLEAVEGYDLQKIADSEVISFEPYHYVDGRMILTALKVVIDYEA